jgi:hypothetical protein
MNRPRSYFLESLFAIARRAGMVFGTVRLKTHIRWSGPQDCGVVARNWYPGCRTCGLAGSSYPVSPRLPGQVWSDPRQSRHRFQNGQRYIARSPGTLFSKRRRPRRSGAFRRTNLSALTSFSWARPCWAHLRRHWAETPQLCWYQHLAKGLISWLSDQPWSAHLRLRWAA